ncbi:MAG: peptide deformylase [Bacillaceae bacterium]|jgi:peptide deformylase|uniref:Peptide deformylase n=2 Tax=Aeribacillus TaxID=1055323 RepID=A0A167YW61_9BACI|nr:MULTISPECIES: peptide deformylase [Aeribacillus]AXI39573.1 peptide deformylase [Bacillaceae bacterium ZC4]REJ16201.1 MAG: peptide deformylase [Bacillaceae bacterium]ASS90942.1 peptide deformylase [Aeribacillus pallidus]KZM53490.1 peptide deformylase [Aeribacillus pallidus]KZN94615.1 peptide deformylase [Aeribacillus pallidus]
MITMEDIIKEGHPTLRQVAKEVELPASEEEKKILAEMLQYLKNSQDPEIAEKYGLRPGIGLAAPQINVSKRMIAVHVTDEKGKLYSYGLFNPKIVSHSVEQSYLTSGEGCLSVDREVPGYVPRYARIRVKGVDLEGNEVDLRLKGLVAIVFQHEIDHLNGIMFYDRINKENPFKEPENATPIDR